MQIKISKQLLKIVRKTNSEFQLIQEGDKVLVGLSGGKDSLSLIHILQYIQNNLPFKFELEACTIHYGMQGEDYTFLEEHCKKYNIKHFTYKTKIFDISQETIRENSSFCSYFSRMRRGAIYNFALKNNFTKIALGHHFDDAVESFFMNIFYNGTIRSLAPIYKTDKEFHLIRPLIQVRESKLQAFVKDNNLQTIGDESCPAMQKNVKPPYARAKMKKCLEQLEIDNKNIYKMILASFKHIHDDTLLDKDRWKRDDI